jgi:type I restriction enzyme S subunit
VTLNLDRTSWQKVKFGDVVRQVKASTDPVADGVKRYVAGEHMDSDGLAITRWGTVGDGYLGPAFHRKFESGQVLYGSRRTYLRKVALADFDGVCANTTFVMETADASRLLPELLPFVMSTEAFHANSIAESKGSVNPYVNWPDIAKYEFELPPLDEQRRIADLVWAIERSSNRVDDLRSALVDFEETFFESKLKDLPGTMVSTEKLLLEGPRNGLSLPAHDGESGFPTVTLTAIRDGEFVAEGNVKWVTVERDTIEPFLVREGDFMVVRGNGNRGLVARGGVVRLSTVPRDCFYPDLLIRLRFDEEKVLPAFAATQWNSRRSHDALLQVAKTTNGTYKINGKDVRNHQLKVPPLSDQADLLEELDRIRRARTKVEGELKRLNDLRLNILNKALG